MALDLVVVVLVLGALGVLAGLVWPHLVDPVMATRSGGTITSSETELVKQVQADGWFAALGAGTCLVAGAVLMWWRGRRDELVTLIGLVAGSLLAAGACAWVGHLVGPEPVTRALASAPDGSTAPEPISVSADAAYLVWPFATVVGTLIILLGRRSTWSNKAPQSDERYTT